MGIRELRDGVVVDVVINPGSKRFNARICGERIIVDVKGKPENGIANRELVCGLNRLFGSECIIIKGRKSRNKSILIKHIDTKGIKKRLNTE